MEVTLDNFEEILPEIIEKIKECDFCSIDCELSGITQYKDLNSFDTPKYRYDKMKKFGLCVFKYKPDTKSYVASAYNCYIFPRTQNCKYSKNSAFSCLNSSIEFLSEQNFDFNKVFKKGISFISKDEEEIARLKLEQMLADREIPKITIYPSNNKDIRAEIDQIMKEIDEFNENENETKKEIKFSELYLKRLKYENKFLENKERLMIITKIDSQNQTNELDDFEKEIGFSKLIWFLSKSQKLIIGHNMLTDIMQILRQFFSSPLPENYEDFKKMTNSLFPKLLDTKYMASIPPLKEIINNTTLGDMDKILSKEPFPKIRIDSEYTINDDKLHEAGYDAFLTGCCYARMLHYLETFNSSKHALEDFYSNKLHMMKCYDISFIDLNNYQEEPKRENVFYIEFPPTWETQDLFNLFSPYGSIFIGWINERSAFVALQNQENVKKAAGQLVGVSGREYRVYFYSTYVNQFSKTRNDSIKTNNSNNSSKTNASNQKRKIEQKSDTVEISNSEENTDLKKAKKE